MTEKESNVKKEAIGDLFGLFGLSDDKIDRQLVNSQTEEGEIIETSDTFCQNNKQFVEISDKINENECIVCHSKEIKYRCPKCQLKTCSLSCCRTHKTRYDCDGIRDKLSFVKMSDFSQTQFLTDYFFLEEVDKSIDNSTRERRSIISSKMILPKWLQKLMREARLRGIDLKLMPAGFSRRKQNTTCFMYNQKAIHWDIEFKFVHALDTKDEEELAKILTEDLVVSHSEYTFIKNRVSEDTKLESLLSQLLETNSTEDSKHKNKLCLYRKLGIDGISVLFRAENRGTNHKKFFELDLNKSIKQNLSRKTVIEFPTFLVVLKKFKHFFEILSEEVVTNTEK